MSMLKRYSRNPVQSYNLRSTSNGVDQETNIEISCIPALLSTFLTGEACPEYLKWFAKIARLGSINYILLHDARP